MSPSIGIGIDIAMRTGGDFSPFVEADLINEDFTVDPSWNEVGTLADVVGGEVVTPADGDTEGSSYFWESFTSQTELWHSFEVTPDAVGLNTNNQCLFPGILQPNNATLASIALLNDAGTLKFRTHWVDDVPANQFNIIASPLPVIGRKYTITIHWKAATAPAADDGIFQVWIGTVLVTDVSNADTDMHTTTKTGAGVSFINAGSTATITYDNVKAGTNGYAL